MNVHKAKIVHNFASIGDNVMLNNPATIAEYLRLAYRKNPLQEMFFAIYLDRKNYPALPPQDADEHTYEHVEWSK